MITSLNVSVSSIKDKIITHGRVQFKDEALMLPWSASGVSVRFVGTAIAFSFLDYTKDGAVHECTSLRLEVDGVSTKACISTGREQVYADGLEDGEHIARLLKASEMDPALLLNEVQVVGENPEIFPYDKKYDLKLEVVGDSITCGYGVYGKRPCFATFEEDATSAYAFKAGELLNADTRLISWSGRGFVKACSGERLELFEDFFLWNTRLEWYGKHDFSMWQPDVLVMNGGTNDYAGGVREPDINEGIRRFYRLARSVYPNAKIVFFYGAMGRWFDSAFQSVIAELRETDPNVYYFSTATITEEANEIGGNGHPSYVAHNRMAKELAEAIKGII